MTYGEPRNARRWAGRAMAVLTLAAAASVLPARAAAGSSPAAAAPARRAQIPARQARALEERVRALARALDLDERQQREVARLLLRQREQVLAIWSDVSVPPARRVAATQAIGDDTTDRIRALLTEEQRRKLGSPRLARAPIGPRASVEDWMGRTTPR